MLSRFSRTFILLLTMLCLGVSLLLVPWATSYWAVDAVFSGVGIAG